MSIFLTGMPGAGKTSVSEYLANKYGLTSIDTDDLIPDIAGKSIPQIFSSEGEGAFRRYEQEAIRRALQEAPDLIALGGGALSTSAAAALVSGHETVYLKASPTVSAARVGKSDSRPLLGEDPLPALTKLYAQREQTYRSVCTIAIETDGRTVAEVAEDLMRSQHELIGVDGNAPYAVRIGRGIAKAKIDSLIASASRKVLLIAPEDMKKECIELAAVLEEMGRQVQGFITPNAEEQKSVDCLSNAWETLGLERFGREDTVIGLGGGATTDLSGFVAATWMRGIDHIAMSTSLLGMVDAAVGGKTGINTPIGKNMVGSFYTPRAVVCDLDYLKSLPKDDLIEGLGEVVKCGFIADPRILELLENEEIGPEDDRLVEIVSRSIRVKANVVSQDLHEAGLREILNYGHTFGHAIEKVENYQWRHGNAVALGMMFAAHVAHELGMISSQLVRRHQEVISYLGLPTSYDGADFPRLLEAMKADKKVRGGVIRMVLLQGSAKPVTVPIEDTSVLQRAFMKVNK